MTVSARDFILTHTRPGSPPLVPEVQLYLSTVVMPLWARLDEATGQVGVDPPFWAFAWVGGQAIARYILDHPEEVQGKRVLDFGAGSGVSGIAALLSGASSVTAYEIDPFAREAITMNARANGVELNAVDEGAINEPPTGVDLILAGDIAYEETMSARVLPWLRGAHDVGIRVLLGDPGRDYFPRQEFVQLTEYEIPTSRDLEGVESRQAGVFTFLS